MLEYLYMQEIQIVTYETVDISMYHTIDGSRIDTAVASVVRSVNSETVLLFGNPDPRLLCGVTIALMQWCTEICYQFDADSPIYCIYTVLDKFDTRPDNVTMLVQFSQAQQFTIDIINRDAVDRGANSHLELDCSHIAEIMTTEINATAGIVILLSLYPDRYTDITLQNAQNCPPHILLLATSQLSNRCQNIHITTV